jgi:hypothetical protein
MPRPRAEVLMFPGVDRQPSIEAIDALREAVEAHLRQIVVLARDEDGQFYISTPRGMTRAEFDELIRESQVYSGEVIGKKPKGGGKGGKKR